MLITAQVLREKWFERTVFAHSQTTNKPANEAANDSARVSGQDRKLYRPFSEPIRLQDLEDSTRSQGWKRKIIKKKHLFFVSLKQNEGLRIISG